MKWIVVAASIMLLIQSVQGACTDVTNCDSCTNHGPECQSCPDHTVISDDKKQCKSCPENCHECDLNEDGETICTECDSGRLEEGACVDCTVDHCLTCIMEEGADGPVEKCTKCDDPGYSLSNGACTGCPEGKYLDGTSCKSCGSNVAKCGSGGIITLCNFDGVKYVKDEAKENCLSCPSGCVKCALDGDAAECTECPEHQYVTDAGECDYCGGDSSSDKNCDVCGDDGVCTDCHETYYLDDGGECQACAHDCDECEDDDGTVKCSDCSDSFGLNEGIICQKCPSNCLTCDYSGADVACETCASGYDLARKVAGISQCYALGTGCTDLANDDSNIVSGSTAKCQTCDSGYVLGGDGQCISCTDTSKGGSAGCTACSYTAVSDTVSCTTCDSGYVEDSGTCYSCTDTSISGSAGCSACTYASSTITCTTCDAGYVEDSGTCYECPSNCDACSYSSGSVCTTCSNGYTLKYGSDGNSAGTCSKCPTKCNLCTSNADGVTCTDCAAKTTLNDGVCSPCPDNCDACSVTDEVVTCTDCADEFGLDADDSCVACIPDCLACDADGDGVQECTACNSEYDINEEQCVACSANCLECSYDEGSMKCSKCSPRYVLSSGACQKCPSSCQECSSSTKCTKGKCDAGYAVNDAGECQDCAGLTNIPNCGMCKEKADANSTATCTACATGYTLKDGLQSGEGAECVSVSDLQCQGGMIADKPSQCDDGSCTADTVLTVDLLCGRLCYSCGDYATNTYVPKDSCKTDNETGIEVKCPSGLCVVKSMEENGETKVLGGCLPTTETCSDEEAGGVCSTADGKEECKLCCSSNYCSNEALELGVSPSNAPAAAPVSFVLLAAIALTTLMLQQ